MDANLPATDIPPTGLRFDKPWGYETLWALTDRYAGKLLHIRQGHSLSLQYHQQKDEWQHVFSGFVRLEFGDRAKLTERLLGPGEGLHVPAGTVHRVHAVTDAVVLEVSTPELDDVVRIEDRYGRAKVSGLATTNAG